MSVLFKNATVTVLENNEYKCLENAYLGTEGKFIDYIGTEKPKKKYDTEKDMTGKILMPGLINSHCHSAMVCFRGLGSDLPLQEWLSIMFPLEDYVMTEDDYLWGMRYAMLEMLASGVTSFSDMYFFPLLTNVAVKESGMKANITRVIMGTDENTDYRTFKNRLQAFELFNRFNHAYDDRLRIDFCIHAEYTNQEHIVKAFAEEIKNIPEARVQLHLSETKKEHDECVAKYGMTPAAWFEKNGIFDVPAMAAHCVWVTDEDLEIFKEKGVSVVHNPESNMKLGSGFAPIVKMLDKGINVGLGTDGAASNNNLNMFEEMHTAALIHKGYLNNPTVMNCSTVLKMATVNGAKIQGRNNTGVLEVGKCADITAVSTDALHMHPNHNSLALLIYSAQASDVCMTMVDGKILYENGLFTTLDKDRIIYEIDKTCKKFK